MFFRFTLWCIVLFATVASSSAQTISYSSLYDNSTFSRTIDISKPVGAIDGSAGTSPSGAATYTIPIKCPPGTNGIAPSLSLVYNSQAGNGPLGQGWSLSGLSAITRAGRDLYHDGKTAPVMFTNDDAFVLDGTRLAPNGANGGSGTTYMTESQSYTVTTSYGNVGGGPQYFNVVSKDGTIMQYGNSDDSRIMSEDGTKVMMWLLNKVQDINGNYTWFAYESIGRDAHISKITYTGNTATGLAPYNEITFEYGLRDDKNRVYNQGYTIQSNYLLKNINVGEIAGDLFKRYRFEFGKNTFGTSYLKSVEEFNGTGEGLNNTRFKYGDEINNYAPASSDISLQYNFPLSSSLNPDLISGDFDGDGKSEILIANYNLVDVNYYKDIFNKDYKNFTIYKQTATGSGTDTYAPLTGGSDSWTGPGKHLVSFKQGNASNSFVVSDFDGDGKDDLFFFRNTILSPDPLTSKMDGTTIYYSRQNSSGFYFDKVDYDPAPIPLLYGGTAHLLPGKNKVIVGDFDGDKRTDYIYMTRKDDRSGSIIDTVNHSFVCFPAKGEMNQQLMQIAAPTENDMAGATNLMNNDIYVLDFDGDGRSEIMMLKGLKTYIYKINKNLAGGYSLELSGDFGYPTGDYHAIYGMGDFNGDGKTDILTKLKTSNFWEIAYAHDNGFEGHRFEFNPDYAFQDLCGVFPADRILIGDFDGDGKSELLHESCDCGNYRDKSTYNTYYFTGVGADNKMKYALKTYAYPGKAYTNTTTGIRPILTDVNGDGRQEISFKPELGTKMQTLYFNKERKSQLLEKVTDGFNRTTTFTYEPLTKGTGTGAGDFYTKGTSEIYPVNNGQYAAYVVTEMQNPDGIGGINTIKLKYANMLLHRAGRGLLGFEKVTTINETANVRTESIYGLDRAFYTPYLKTTKTFVNSTGAQLSQADQEMSFTPIGSGYCFEQQNTGSTVQDLLKGVTTTTTNTFDGFGNITNTSSTTTGGETVTASVSTTYIATGGSTNPNRPSVVTTTAQRGSATAVSMRSTYDYLPNGLTKQCITVAIGDVTTSARTDYEYDAYGNMTQKAAHNFTISYAPFVAYEYDSKGRFVTSEQHNGVPEKKYFTTHKFWGTPLTVTGINGLTTTNTYDNWGKLRSSTVPTGVGTAYTINYKDGWAMGTNRLFYTLVEDPSAPDTRTTYDLLVRAVETRRETFGGAWTTALTAYDASGNVSSSTNNYLASETPMTTTNTYDELNRIANSSSVFGNTGYSYSYGSGVATTTVTLPDGKIKSNTVDALGKLLRSNSNSTAGVVSFEYDSRGNEVQTTLNQSGVGFSIPLITKEYDAMGQLKTMRDPDAGTTKYKYTVFGQLEQQTDPKGKVTRFEYDAAGRLTRTTLDGYTTLYTYFGADKDYRLQSVIVTGPEGTVEDQYDYFQGGGMIRHSKITNGVLLEKQLTYDGYNRPLSTIYLNSSFRTRNYYDGNGFLLRVKTDFTPGGSGDKLLYEATAMNGNGQITHLNRLDGQSSTVSYANGFATNYTTPGLQNLSMEYNYANGNLLSRSDNLKGTTEQFTYDALDRLTKAEPASWVSGISHPPLDMTYDLMMGMSLGQIRAKSDVGTYNYVGFPRNGVIGITDPAGRISHETQAVKYTLFDKTQLITENIGGVNYEESLVYDAGQSRAYSQQKQDGVIKRKRWYLEDMEIQEPAGAAAQVIHYISGADGLCGMVVAEGGVFRYYAAYTDHLGSIVTLTTEVSGGGVAVVAEQSYDAWGQERNPNTWAATTALPAKPSWLYRGYTGHEMLPEYGLVNMNGRLYDPLNGRMLRPDNFVQDPANSQSYNRFSYCLNNPLKYTDPSGNFWALPYVGISPYGVDFGLSVGMGLPGGASLQGAIGYSTSGNAYISAGATLGGMTASIGWGTQSGFGVYAGIGLGLGKGWGTNMTSAGIGWSQHGGFYVSGAGITVNDQGMVSFNPSISFTFGYKETRTAIKAGPSTADIKPGEGGILTSEATVVIGHITRANKGPWDYGNADPKSLFGNWFGSSYIGPSNPTDYNGFANYDYRPRSIGEYPAINHDLGYDKVGAAGFSGVLFNTMTINADLRLFHESLTIALMPNVSLQARYQTIGSSLLIIPTLPKMAIYYSLPSTNPISLLFAPR